MEVPPEFPAENPKMHGLRNPEYPAEYPEYHEYPAEYPAEYPEYLMNTP